MILPRSALTLIATLCMLLPSAAAQGLRPGSYRCSAYNVSGGGGSCENFPRLILKTDGSYQYSSTTGTWSEQGGRLVLSESKLWGRGKVLGHDTVRFEYDYRGWHHTVTWICEDCFGGRSDDSRSPRGGGGGTDTSASYVGVSLTLRFRESAAGVSSFAIVPVESAKTYYHNAPVPEGGAQGLAWTTEDNVVRLATGRLAKLETGRRYIVFLDWPAETLPVAVLDLPSTDRDYQATLPAQLHMAIPAATQPMERSGRNGSYSAENNPTESSEQDRSARPDDGGGASPSHGQPPRIGVELVDVTPQIANAVGYPDLRGAGVLKVAPSSLAERAGIVAGDIIVEVNGKQVRTAEEAKRILLSRNPSQPLKLTVLHEGRRQEIRVI